MIKYFGKQNPETNIFIYCRDTDVSLAMSFEEFDFPIIGKS